LGSAPGPGVGCGPPRLDDAVMTETPAASAISPISESALSEIAGVCKPGAGGAGSAGVASPRGSDSLADSVSMERWDMSHLSISQGPAAGGCCVWVQGDGFTPELLVLFGDVPAKSVCYVCPQLIKCVAPPACVPNRRHAVEVRLVSPISGLASPRPLHFVYVPDATLEASGTSAAAVPQLLDRLLCSLERAQAAAAASPHAAPPHAAGFVGPPASAPVAATPAPPSGISSAPSASAAAAGPPAPAPLPPPVAAPLALPALSRVFHTVDEHGYSLAEYVSTLRRSFGAGGARLTHRDGTAGGPSELQAQHAELAYIRTVERLSASLANRPAPQALLERHILIQEGEAQQLAAKRKRLEGFLAERPPPESIFMPETVEAMLQSPRAEGQRAPGGGRPPHV